MARWDDIQAIILIGGEGTRLRPLTLDVPKPLLPVVNRPFLAYPLDQLRRHGIRDVVLCTAYRPAAFRKVFGDGRKFGLRIRYVHERKPLGTGGAIKNAQRWVRGTSLIFNGDVLNEMDFDAFLQFHRRKKADASIALISVEDPTRYGVVDMGSDRRIRRFVEKPKRRLAPSNKINAGAYIFEPAVFGKIPAGKAVSVERKIFPSMLVNGSRLFGFVRRGYWLDIGRIDTYLEAHRDILHGRTPWTPPGRKKGRAWLERGARLAEGVRVEGPAALGAGARVGRGALLDGAVSIGPDCLVGEGAFLEDCVLLAGARVGARARISRSVIGPGAKIGEEAFVAETALGAKAVVPPYSRLGAPA